MATFCTKDDLKNRNFEIEKHPTELSDAYLDQLIEDISDYVETLLFNTQGTVQDMPNTPRPIRDLTIYGCMEEILIRMYSAFRSGDGTDIILWQERAEKQYQGIVSHRIRSADMPRPSFGTNKADKRWKPAFGYGKYGERILRSDLPDDETGYETREIGGEEWSNADSG